MKLICLNAILSENKQYLLTARSIKHLVNFTLIDRGFLWCDCKQETNNNENIDISTKPPRSVSAKFLIRQKIYMTDRPWRVENVSGLKWATELIHFNSREQLAFLCSTWGRREVWCGEKVQYVQKEFKPKMSACQLPISGPPSVLAEYLVLDEQMIQFTILIISSLRITCSRKAWTWSASTPFPSHPASAPESSQSTFQHRLRFVITFDLKYKRHQRTNTNVVFVISWRLICSDCLHQHHQRAVGAGFASICPAVGQFGQFEPNLRILTTDLKHSRW